MTLSYLKQFIPLKEKHICAYIIHTRMGRESLANDSGTQALTEKKKESLVTAVYLGAIFIILALVFVLNTGIWVHITNFFSSLTLAPLPGTGITLPAPVTPAAHTTLYAIAFQFTMGIGLLEMVVLVVRILLHSPIQRKAETVENLVFWLGTSYLIISYLINITLQTEWFVFWAGIILIGGVSLVTRAFILFVSRNR